MGIMIEWNGRQREVVKVKSDSPGHAGFYTTFRDAMAPGDEECQEPGERVELQPGERPDDAADGVCIDPQGLEPIPPKKGRKAK